NQTAFAKQLLENGRKDFHFARAGERGEITDIDFKVNAEAVRWAYHPQHPDLAVITLNTPLEPGNSITITTPFKVKIPFTFSRLGHVGQSYQISQWYPKPAVFDKDGWHPMPYLDMGEFYSEYGSFDVRITLPANYIVGATGILQSPEEQRWIDSLIQVFSSDSFPNRSMLKKRQKNSDDFPASSNAKKTISYSQNNIHDFAWFADKRYRIMRDTVKLPQSGRVVTCTALFLPSSYEIWKNATAYLKDAILFYSRLVGEYPYDVVTAVEGALQAGGGMEYPTITVITGANSAENLDEIITHEVGHNWFYGILGTNERLNPWMDEGVNSYYERKYMQWKYPGRKLFGKFADSKLGRLLDLQRWKRSDLNYLAYLMQARENRDQPASLPADVFTPENTGVVVYLKTALMLEWLSSYLGEDTFNLAMKTYYDKWKFKHPGPRDFREIFEQVSGKNLSWWFDTLLSTTIKNDFAIKKVKEKEKGIYSLEIDKTIAGAPAMPLVIKDKFIAIDTGLITLDIWPQNNFYYLKRLAKKTPPLRLQFLQSLENPFKTHICFAPWLGWNNYDKTMVGIAFYHPIFPSRKFTYLIAPAYSTAARTIVGGMNMKYHFYPETGSIQHLYFGIQAKRYSYLLFPESLQYNKVEPSVFVEFKKKRARSPHTHFLFVRSANIWLSYNFRQQKETISRTQHYFVNEVSYAYERKTTLHPMQVKAFVRQGDYFLQLSAEADFTISYPQGNKGFNIRVFAGGTPLYFKAAGDINAPVPRMFLSMNTVRNPIYWLQRDYMFDETFIDRNGTDRIFARQIAYAQGAFRSLTTFGATRNFLMSANLSSSLPLPVPLYPWASAAAIYNELERFEFAAEAGFSIGWKNTFEFHFPLVTTKNIRENQQNILGIRRFYERISFTARLRFGNTRDLITSLLD
ncbi:MAG: M1 family metallopeptidase, partial [Chitinophagales bacterium]|nr:M1 family metallopeptidase [Chitinophagales bacterium]MDW8274024.1 M1 family metallopeptidase [Chitinophagales bacterium]